MTFLLPTISVVSAVFALLIAPAILPLGDMGYAFAKEQQEQAKTVRKVRRTPAL